MPKQSPPPSPSVEHRRSLDPAPGAPKLRIVHLVSSLQVGGMEQFVLRIAREQQSRGHHVAVIGLQGGPLLDQAHAVGIDAKALGGTNTLGRVVRATIGMAQWRPDIAHAHNPSALQYALLAKLSGPARVVMTRHGQGARRVGSRLQWRGTDAVVAVSEAAAEALCQSNPEHAAKISVIQNGVHLTEPARGRKEIRRELGLDDGLVGAIVARIDHLKGHDSLLKALALLRDRGISLTLLVVGDGPERESREQLARELGLGPEHVRFLGYRADVSDLLGAADFFALPSLTEGLPLCVLEAMAQRLPVVATPVGGIPELVTDGQHGLLVPVDDPAALSRAIAELAGDPARRRSLGEAGCARVRERFSFETMAEAYEQLYYRLGARPRGVEACEAS